MIAYKTELCSIKMVCCNWSLEDSCPARIKSGQWHDKCPWRALSHRGCRKTHQALILRVTHGHRKPQHKITHQCHGLQWMHWPEADSTGTEGRGQLLFPCPLPRDVNYTPLGSGMKQIQTLSAGAEKMGPKPAQRPEASACGTVWYNAHPGFDYECSILRELLVWQTLSLSSDVQGNIDACHPGTTQAHRIGEQGACQGHGHWTSGLWFVSFISVSISVEYTKP